MRHVGIFSSSDAKPAGATSQCSTSASGFTPRTSPMVRGRKPEKVPSWSRGLSPSRWFDSAMYLSRRSRHLAKDALCRLAMFWCKGDISKTYYRESRAEPIPFSAKAII